MMDSNSRLRKSLLNLTSGFACRGLIMLTAFFVRTVFIRCLSNDYLGINGLYFNILSMLSLAELGFGTAMVYSMYAPLAQKDYQKLKQLIYLYRTAYTIIGCVVLALGLCVVPFLDILIKDKPNIEGLTFYYLLFLGDTVLSYWFFAYRTSILQADQKTYIITSFQSIFNLIKSGIQIICLLIFKNYTLYLLIQISCTIIQNCAVAVKVRQNYPVFERPSEPLSKAERNKIFDDVKALMLSKISFVFLNSSDTIIISSIIGLSWVGLLSNYNLIVEAIVGILSQIMSAISASLGNFFVKEEQESGYTLMRRIDFLHFWLYGFSMISLIVLLTPFITLWLGDNYILSRSVVIALSLRFFVQGIMNMLSGLRSTLGLFVQGKYRPLVAAALNIVLSIVLGIYLGVTGILLATVITRLSIQLWFSAMTIHRVGFNKPVKPYYIMWIKRFALLSAITCLMLIVSEAIFQNGITYLNFTIMVTLTALIPNSILIIFSYRSNEFQYFWCLAKNILTSIKTNLKSS